MKNNLRIASIIAFVVAIPVLIITDWYVKGMGLFFMFMCITIGLILDQTIRMLYSKVELANRHAFQMNKLLNIAALILLVQSPIALVYGNRYHYPSGIYGMISMIIAAIAFNQVARMKFNVQEEK